MAKRQTKSQDEERERESEILHPLSSTFFHLSCLAFSSPALACLLRWFVLKHDSVAELHLYQALQAIVGTEKNISRTLVMCLVRKGGTARNSPP